MKNKGFTLIEMLVSLAIFSVLIVTIMSTFVKGLYYQKRVSEMQTVEREGAYLMETVSREVRMASHINDDQQGHRDVPELEFTDHGGKSVQYCHSKDNVCSSSGGTAFSIKRDGVLQQINSPSVRITELNFFTSDSFATAQPLITISMTIQSVKEPNVSTVLQTSVAMRLYK